jgi:hypothetical protein
LKSYPAPSIPDDIVTNIRNLAASGASQDDVIQKMRDSGLNIIASIKLLKRFFPLSTNEAKYVVHCSNTWSDCRAANEAIHEAAFQAAEELARQKQTISG